MCSLYIALDLFACISPKQHTNILSVKDFFKAYMWLGRASSELVMCAVTEDNLKIMTSIHIVCNRFALQHREATIGQIGECPSVSPLQEWGSELRVCAAVASLLAVGESPLWQQAPLQLVSGSVWILPTVWVFMRLNVLDHGAFFLMSCHCFCEVLHGAADV